MPEQASGKPKAAGLARSVAPADSDASAARARKQREIDIKNLRFYAEMFRQHEWSTHVIHWGVFEQTLNEIADRLAGRWDEN